MTQLIEGLFGHKSGADKKNTALALEQNTIQATDAVTGKDIVDPEERPKDGCEPGTQAGRQWTRWERCRIVGT